MNGHQPHTHDAVIHHLRATLTQRAGDHTITPAFTARVQRLRRRRHLTIRAVQTTAMLAVVAVTATGIYQTLRPTRQLEFTAPPPATASPTPTPTPTPTPSPSTSDDTTPTEQTSDPAAQDTPSPPPAQEQEPNVAPPSDVVEEPSVEDLTGDAANSGAPGAGTIENAAFRWPALLCTEDDGTIVAEIDFTESETAYVIDPAEPVTVRVYSDVGPPIPESDSVEVTEDGDRTAYLATFTPDSTGYPSPNVRIEGPTDPPAC
jgi:hypothetical protein